MSRFVFMIVDWTLSMSRVIFIIADWTTMSHDVLLYLQGAVDLNTSNFYDMFLYGGVNLTTFNTIDKRTDIYRRWGSLAEKYSLQFKDLFPFKVLY